MSPAVPVVDLSALRDRSGGGAALSAGGPSSALSIAEPIRRACTGGGFFYVENHGVDPAVHERLFDAAGRFFALPESDKMSLFIGRDPSRYSGGYIPLGGETTESRRDWHEALDVQPAVDADGHALSPFGADSPLRGLPWLFDALAEGWPPLQELACRLAGCMAIGLGVGERFFADAIPEPLGVIRLAHYPAHPDELPGDVGHGIGAHTDYGFLTIVSQDDVGGLEVRDLAGDWHPVPRREGALAVMAGRVIERWSNGVFKAGWHRVRIPRGRARCSVSYFFEPGYRTVIDPLPTCCGPDNPPRYPPCEFGQIMALRYSTSFASYG